MTQHTQPVVAAQHQQQSSTSQQQQQVTSTSNNNNNNNNQSNNINNNNTSTPTAMTTNASTTTNQTQTVDVQQQQLNQNNNNINSYQSQQNIAGPIYNPQLQPANAFVPAHGIPAHHHHPQTHHQPGAVYQTMIPAAIPSNVYVNNVTANVNLHGWTHTVPHGAWIHPGGAPHYIHGDLPNEQATPVIQPMGTMPVGLQNTLTGPLLNPNVNAISGGTRGSRRGRGRGGSSGSRRGDYSAAQRHPPSEDSPAPQQSGQNNQQDLQQQQQATQSSDTQQMLTAVPQSYVPHPQYAPHASQYPYGYPAFFAPPQHMLHPGQSAAAQQATGAPLYFSPMPLYNGHPVYNYGYYPILNQPEYQYVSGEEMAVGGDDRQTGGETGSAMLWHPPPIYTDEYGNITSADIHAVVSDDINQNASSMGSAADTPSLLSPNYAPIYDPQLQEQMTQQMSVMQIYDESQMGQMQVIHQQTAVPHIEDELSECVSQPSTQIQMVSPIQLIPTSPSQITLTAANAEQQIINPHLISVAATALMPIDTNITSNTTVPASQHQIQELSFTGDNNIDNSNSVQQSYENVVHLQQGESVTSLNNEELVQQPIENLPQDYQKQQQMQTQTENLLVETVQIGSYSRTRTTMTEVQEIVQEQSNLSSTKTDVGIETVTSAVNTFNMPPLPQQPEQQQHQQQQQPVYQQQIQDKAQKQQHQQQQYVAKQQQQQPQPQPQQEYQQTPQQPSIQQQYQGHQQQQQQQQQQGLGHHHHHQQQQLQHQQSQQTSYENRKSSQMYNQQHQSRRKYDYHHSHNSTGSNSSSNDTSVHNNTQQHQQQQQTTKTMSWTNSSQHKKSTNTVAVTATPTSSHTGAGNYNKSSSNATNSSSAHPHTTRTYTNQQHHNYQQQQQQQQNYHQQQQQPQQYQPQTRNYGAMKMPSSPIASVTNPMERKTSQTIESGKFYAQQQQQTTSTASTTVVPHQFQQQQHNQQSQQTSTNDNVQHNQMPLSPISSNVATATATTTNTSKSQHYPPGFANKKHSFSIQGHSFPSNTPNVAATVTTANSSHNTTEMTAAVAPAINLAPPVTASTVSVPSTPSWASLFSNNSNTNSLSSAASTAVPANTLVSNTSSSLSYAKKPIAKVAPYEVSAPVTPSAPIVTPGALSYSAASAQNLPPPNATAAAAKNATTSPSDKSQSQRNSVANLDEFSLKFAEFLTKYKSDWANVSLRPRGLTNRSNYCYINSILQALLGCSPLYNLIRSIPKQAANLCEVKTPTINAMITFMSNFSNLPSGLRLRNSKGTKNNKDDLGSDLQCDSAFEPTEIYKLWNDSREEHVEGRQEDAEEFLSYILNKLNDEMLEVIKLIAKPTPEQNGQNGPPEEDGDVWQMICNNRNKGSVTRQTDFGCTPLSDIFRGELRSRLQREGEHSTDVIQPFFTLQLNIEKAASVKEALEILVGRDQLEGVTGSKTKQEVVAWQQMNLEKLPPILILHLKWFDYRSDGCTKIIKKVEFPVELKIDAKILASKKYSQKQRAYRLFAVVYHDGKEATKGHYITDVYHTGYGSWLRYDDSSVKPVSENHVLLPRTPRVPYLLCYRRCDTIPQQSNNNQNSSGGGGGGGNNNNSSGNTQLSGK